MGVRAAYTLQYLGGGNTSPSPRPIRGSVIWRKLFNQEEALFPRADSLLASMIRNETSYRSSTWGAKARFRPQMPLAKSRPQGTGGTPNNKKQELRGWGLSVLKNATGNDACVRGGHSRNTCGASAVASFTGWLHRQKKTKKHQVCTCSNRDKQVRRPFASPCCTIASSKTEQKQQETAPIVTLKATTTATATETETTGTATAIATAKATTTTTTGKC